MGANPESAFVPEWELPRSLDLVDDPFEDSSVPSRRTAVPGETVVGMPFAAVDFPGGLGLG